MRCIVPPLPSCAVRSIGPLVMLLVLIGCTKDGQPMDTGPLDIGPPTAEGTLPGDRGPTPDVQLGPPVNITLATFNVHNLFDEANDANKKDDVFSAAEVEAKLKKVAAALRRLDADVVALQEVENKTLLTRLNDSHLSGLGYDTVRLIEGNDIRGTDVALLSRYPVTRLLSHARDRFKGIDGDPQTFGFSRDCLEATVEPSPGRKLVLLINHLRAQGDNEADRRRWAQAQRVREIADGLLSRDPNANLAIVGDLNDEPGTKTLSLIFTGAAPLKDVAETLPANERYTTAYKGDKQQFDYIIASTGLMADLVSGSVKIPRDSVFSATSDHAPVLAEFRLE